MLNLMKISISPILSKCPRIISIAGMKNFPQPITYDDVEFTEKPKLRFFDKVPQLPPNLKAPKMQKRLRYMRGPEKVVNFLQNQQYGIQATGGGRMRWGHFEMLRLGIGRKMDTSRMFAIWRIDAPWQPVTKLGQGKRMGGGKGAIDHYVTPIKAGRIIVELCGKCEFAEVEGFLKQYADILPFKARPVSHEMLLREAKEEELKEKHNQNPYTFKYIVQNNMGGFQRHCSPFDHIWYGKHH